MNDKYIEILHDKFDFLKINENNLIEIKAAEERIHLNIITDNGHHLSFYTIGLKNGKIMMRSPFTNDNLLFDNLEFFKEYTSQIFEQLKKELISLYKKGFINTLPDGIVDKPKNINLVNLCVVDFYEIFNRCAKENGNSEKCEDVKMQILEKTKYNPKSLKIDFAVDCNRYGLFRNKSISISERGNINIDLMDTPLEGGDVEYSLKEELSKLILNV